MSVKLSTLPNGLRVLTDHIPDMHSTAIGIWCGVGTRYEDLSQNGIAHLVEHMLFKGTPSRSAYTIAESIEKVGGQMNAYTSREYTAYFIHLLKEDTPLALETLADMMCHSTFPEEELTKEREVILQEIGMTNDTPDDLVFDLHQETAYPAQALGAPILGTADIIRNMPRDALPNYTRTFYTPDRLVISAAGFVDHDALVQQVEELFSDLKAPACPLELTPAQYKGGCLRADKELEQVHLVMGFQGTARKAENYYAAQLLSTLSGGGMSSRLFQEVREKRGLVYSVYTHHSGYRDDGLFEIYAGTGPERLQELIPVICDEIVKLKQECVTEDELARAKSQMKANLLMARESMLSRADRQAKHLLNFGRMETIDETLAKIDGVEPQMLCDLAAKMFSGTPTLAALGPLQNLEEFDKIQDRLAA